MEKKRIVLFFGAFDGLHDGHRFFLREAKKQGARLIASVATDGVVAGIKRSLPVFPLAERMQALRESGLVDEAVAGDTKLGSWSAVKRYRPDVIALGYDQTELERELRAYIAKENLPIHIHKIAARNPTRFHSRLLRGK